MRGRGGAILLFCTLLASCSTPPEDPLKLVRFGVPYDPENLDPHGSDTLSGIAVSSHFYEGLVKIDGHLRILPAIASRWETPELTLWRFHLRPGVRFHDGKPLTAVDVVYSFERVMKNPSLEISIYARNISTVRAVNDQTVEVITKQQNSVLLNKIRLISIIPAGTRDENFANKVNGTGPYKLKSWEKGKSIKMIRNENYWGDPPAIENAEFDLGLAPELAMQRIRDGSLHLVQCNSKRLENELPSQYESVRGDSLFVRYIGFGLQKEANSTNSFQNLKVREAIHKSLDRKSMVSELSSYAVPASQPVPVFVFGYNPSIALVEPDRTGCAAIFQKSGLSAKVPVVMHVRHVYEETARLVSKQMEPCGVRLQVRSHSDPEFFELRDKKKVQSWIGRYGCTTGDASDLVEDLLYSQEHEATNTSRYLHPHVDKNALQNPRVDNIEHRREGLQTLMSMLMQDLLIIPLYVEQDSFALHKSYMWEPRYDSLVLAYEVKARQ